jgi:PAS domain S-box-containing protein
MAFLHENKISHQTILRNPFVDVPGSDAYECILDHIASFLESRQYQLWLAERLNISAPLDDNDIVNLFVGTTHFSNAEYTQLLALLIPKIEHMVQYKSIIRCRNGWFRCLIGFIQHLKVGAYITVQDDEDKNIVVYHNKHVEVLMGYSPGDLIGAPCPCFSKQNDTIKDESLQATLKSQLPFSISHTCIKKDGSEMLSVVMSKPLFDTSNNNQFNIIFQVEENSEEIQALCKFLFFMPNTV